MSLLVSACFPKREMRETKWLAETFEHPIA